MTIDSASVRPRGDTLLPFGITGDLGASKIIPALGQLARAGHLDGAPVVGVGRSSRSDDEIEAMMRDALDGAHDHFTGVDDIVSARRLVEALRVDEPPRSYRCGSSGPA